MSSKKSKSKSRKSMSKAVVPYEAVDVDIMAAEEMGNMQLVKKSSKKSSQKKSTRKSSYTGEDMFVVVASKDGQIEEKVDHNYIQLKQNFLPEWCGIASRLQGYHYMEMLGKPSYGHVHKGGELIWFKNPHLIASVLSEDCDYKEEAAHFFHAFRVIDKEFDPEFMCGQTREALVKVEADNGVFEKTGLLSLTTSHVKFPHVFKLDVMRLSSAGLPIFYDPFHETLTVYGSKEADLHFWQLLVFSMIEDAGLDPLVNEKKRGERKYGQDAASKQGNFADYWKSALEQHLIRRLQANKTARHKYEKEIRKLAFQAYHNLSRLVKKVEKEIEKKSGTPDEFRMISDAYDCKRQVTDSAGKLVPAGTDNALVDIAAANMGGGAPGIGLNEVSWTYWDAIIQRAGFKPIP